MKQNNKPTQPKYILGEQLPENSILGAIGTDMIRSTGITYTDDFTMEFARAIVKCFKDNPDEVQDKGNSE